MRIVEENEDELYLEVELEDLPLTIETPGKKLYIRLAEDPYD